MAAEPSFFNLLDLTPAPTLGFHNHQGDDISIGNRGVQPDFFLVLDRDAAVTSDGETTPALEPTQWLHRLAGVPAVQNQAIYVHASRLLPHRTSTHTSMFWADCSRHSQNISSNQQPADWVSLQMATIAESPTRVTNVTAGRVTRRSSTQQSPLRRLGPRFSQRSSLWRFLASLSLPGWQILQEHTAGGRPPVDHTHSPHGRPRAFRNFHGDGRTGHATANAEPFCRKRNGWHHSGRGSDFCWFTSASFRWRAYSPR